LIDQARKINANQIKYSPPNAKFIDVEKTLALAPRDWMHADSRRVAARHERPNNVSKA
jgi:hypothetical protein